MIRKLAIIVCVLAPGMAIADDNANIDAFTNALAIAQKQVPKGSLLLRARPEGPRFGFYFSVEQQNERLQR